MEYTPDPAARTQLLDRRERLVETVSEIGSTPELLRLLAEVDAALERHAAGTYGLCESCGDTIEAHRLRVDPLIRFCIDHLSRGERDALERDLELAGRVQQALLPRRDVAVDGWEIHWRFEPAGPVSGDYCDLVLPRRDGDGVLFVVGDVSGKGVAASLLSAHLNALFRTLAETGAGVAEMMEKANRLFCESTLESHYATLVAGRAWPDGRVEIGNAGQGAPLVARNGVVEPIRCGGLPLGMFCTTSYAPARLTLSRGESLVVYTDGLSEAENGRSEPFGEGGLLRALTGFRGRTAADLARHSLDAVAAFRGGAPRADDLTLLVARRTD